jgi:ribosomal protein RSM22 (predicted rRNA methylase)
LSEPIVITAVDWERLREMRRYFLNAAQYPGTLPDYWKNRRDLELYDATFGARIGWKWRAVLDEIEHEVATPGAMSVLDFGCGTGVASRAWITRFGAARVVLSDRSRAAAEFAAERVRELGTATTVEIAAPEAVQPADVLLISHVLDELEPEELERLTELARAARWVVWIEPGDSQSAARLEATREKLLGDSAFDVVAPCTHRAACGALARTDMWCHHFAKPAPEAFTSNHWRRFALELEIDLRALPYAYLVLMKSRPPRAPDRARILGRPRIEKGLARLDVCDAGGVRTLRFLERTDKQLFKQLSRAAGLRLVFRVRANGERIEALEPDSDLLS